MQPLTRSRSRPYPSSGRRSGCSPWASPKSCIWRGWCCTLRVPAARQYHSSGVPRQPQCQQMSRPLRVRMWREAVRFDRQQRCLQRCLTRQQQFDLRFNQLRKAEFFSNYHISQLGGILVCPVSPESVDMATPWLLRLSDTTPHWKRTVHPCFTWRLR